MTHVVVKPISTQVCNHAVASENNHAWLLAHDVIPVEYGDGLEERVRAAAPRGVQALIDTFGPEYIDLALALGVPPEAREITSGLWWSDVVPSPNWPTLFCPQA